MLSSLLLRQRLMATSLLLAALAVSAARVSARQETKAPSPGPSDVELVIAGPREDVADKPPREYHARLFRVTLINHSSHPVVFGPSSLESLPQVETSGWRVTDPSGKLVPYRPLLICKVAPVAFFQERQLTDADLLVIPPGESRELSDLDISMWFKLDEPGEYKIYREFTFSPPFGQMTMAGGTKFVGTYDVSAMSPEKLQMLREARGFKVKSNVWTLVIK
jgi:hypothetical protein